MTPRGWPGSGGRRDARTAAGPGNLSVPEAVPAADLAHGDKVVVGRGAAGAGRAAKDVGDVLQGEPPAPPAFSTQRSALGYDLQGFWSMWTVPQILGWGSFRHLPLLTFLKAYSWLPKMMARHFWVLAEPFPL